ncbi:MAG TPA: NAD-dependent epimerase/dehydratase family protein [Pirellulales bacterium]|jgi:nucleoside-diphosphate-sugar epimerase|nr:NAD-dependent epimerase/dehydratase family protein [Pirellulales bacterium]
MIAPRTFDGRSVLVTGGLGFLGSNLAIRLARLGARVTILDSLVPQFGGSYFNIQCVRDLVAVNISDMRDPNSLDILVRDQDYIFNLAGQVSHGDSMRDPQLDLGVNCVSTMNLVEACRKHNPAARMLYTSTRQVYGRPQKLPVSEDHPTLPIDVNGINKLAAEYYHLLYHSTYGIRSTVLRLTNTFGPRQQIRSNRQGFATIFLRLALRGETISLFGGGQQLRDFNYVDDAVEAMLLAITNDACLGRVFNLGSTRAYSLVQFVEILKRFCKFKVESIPFPDDKKIIDIGDYYGDFSRFCHATGWQPRVDLEEGLERTVAFYREHKEVYWQ